MRDKPKFRSPEEDRIKVIVAGSRTFRNYMILRDELDELLAKLDDPIIVSGGAEGADKLGEQYAFENWLEKRVFHYPKGEGKSGGPIRNAEMAKYADCLIAFWDGRSPGTRDMIETAKAQGLQVRIVRI